MARRVLIVIIMFLLIASMGVVMVRCSPSPHCSGLLDSFPFLHQLYPHCPIFLSYYLPIEMDAESVERVLGSTFSNGYAAILFYDSGSPFSSGIRSEFNILSSMYQQISHIAVEQSLVMPSLFSRYGIHSLPVLFIVNQTERMRYYGSKDFHSLANFYKRSTGLEPLEYDSHDDLIEIMNAQPALRPWYWLSWKDMIVKEPYLVFAILFLMLKVVFFLCPEIMSHVTALWILCKHRINLGIFGESRQLLDSVVHLIDVKRLWSKLKRCKTRNFQKGARSARVWASSLASVSLGKTSARPSSTSTT